MPAMTKKQVKLIDQIRRAASECGMGQNALARAAGIDKGRMSRFISGERGLSMEALDALADVLNLRIVAGKPKRKAR
jgi:transcriptional regulator with XRE-family HTH domain